MSSNHECLQCGSRLVEIDHYGERLGLSRLQCLAKRGTHPRDRIRVGAARRSPPVDALRNPLGETLKVSASPERGRISFSLYKMAVNAAKHYLPTCDFEATKSCSGARACRLAPDDIIALRAIKAATAEHDEQSDLERQAVKGCALCFSTGSSGLLAAQAFAAKRVHNYSFVGRIGPVIVPRNMALDHKS